MMHRADLLTYAESTAMAIDAAISAYRNHGKDDYIHEARKLSEQLLILLKEAASRE